MLSTLGKPVNNKKPKLSLFLLHCKYKHFTRIYAIQHIKFLFHFYLFNITSH